MLIKGFRAPEAEEGNLFYSCGLIEYNRDIYIFVNPQEYANGIATIGKAAIINRCVYPSDSKFNYVHEKHDNSLLVRTSVYFCDIVFEVPNDVKSIVYTVDSASSYEKEKIDLSILSDMTTLQHNPSLYSSHLGDVLHNPIDEDQSYGLSDWVNNQSQTQLIPPNYYTEAHMFLYENDYFPLYSYDYLFTTNAEDLYDNKTRLQIININMWSTMKAEILSKLIQNEIVSSNTYDISAEIKSSFENLVGEDGIFIFDSNALGTGQSKVTIKGGDVPLKNFYHRKFLRSNINVSLQTFYNRCKDIEGKFGNIRVLCRPNLVGTKMKLYFRDFYPENQPIKPLSVDTNTTSSIDNGYSITQAIDSTIDMFQSEPLHNEIYAGEIYPIE